MKYLIPLLLILASPALAQPATSLQICQQIAGNQIGQISELASQLQTANAKIVELTKQLADTAKKEAPANK